MKSCHNLSTKIVEINLNLSDDFGDLRECHLWVIALCIYPKYIFFEELINAELILSEYFIPQKNSEIHKKLIKKKLFTKFLI